LSRASARGGPSLCDPWVQERLTRLRSGLLVASAKGFPPDRSHLVLSYRAGTRYETSNQRGLVRLIRGIMDNPKKIGRNPIRLPPGSEIASFLTPDILGVALTVPRHRSNQALEYLDRFTALKDCDLDLSVLPKDGLSPGPSTFATEYVRRAAYGNGTLANPIEFKLPESRLKYTDDDVRHFAATHMVANNAALVGVNVKHDE
ncbi:hypothetical protein PMAYCL1PPCAC_20450, partial [Pristionchus mayeri]